MDKELKKKINKEYGFKILYKKTKKKKKEQSAQDILNELS